MDWLWAVRRLTMDSCGLCPELLQNESLPPFTQRKRVFLRGVWDQSEV